MEPMSRPDPVLDPRRLALIEGAHRGFLYQHLYAAGCLFLASVAEAAAVAVERDEDIEIIFATRRVYVQVKTRSEPLGARDIRGALDWFARLRTAHATGTRSGAATFWIVSNVAPGPALSTEMQQSDWPSDVRVRWPGHDASYETALPPAWSDASGALTWCAERAAGLPFASLSPETLVWKLAGCVLLASSGGAPREDHRFSVSELPVLFEQLVVQMQDFPVVPTRYRAQQNEPALLTGNRNRIVSGFSGAGKTAWASHASLHVPGVAAYFDAADVPGPTLAASLVRELAGRLLDTRKGALGEVLLPGANGLDMLRLLERRLERHRIDAVIVIDNAHRIPMQDLRTLIEATRRLRIVVLCQPSPEVHALALTLRIEVEQLAGWTTDTIAAAVADSGGRADYAACQRLLATTAGLPLYVQSAIEIAVSQYAGDVAQLCNDIDRQAHVVAIAQETILARLYGALPQEEKDAVAVLSAADCPLTKDEASALVEKAIGLRAAAFTRAVRRLAPFGVVQVFGNERLKVHDAIRVLGAAHLHELGDTVVQSAHVALKDSLAASLIRERDISRFALLVRLLGLTGDVETLVDLAGEEMFHEMGFAPDFKAVLEDAARREELPPELRFWALDAVVFAELKQGDGSRLPECLDAMTLLVNNHRLTRREHLALGMKRMLFAARRGSEPEVRQALRELVEIVPDDPAYLRILKYNAACALHLVDRHGPAKALALEVAQEYYEHLGIEFSDVFAKNHADIWPLLPKSDTIHDDLKHLADSLDLCARCCDVQGMDSGFARIHAFKFYAMVDAIDSALKVGQDLVDEFLRRGDPVGARQVLEGSLLPSVYRAKMVDRVVPLRSQYAVVLAYCGQFDAAEAEMARLLPYVPGLPGRGRQELRNQRAIIAALRAERARIGGGAGGNAQPRQRHRKIGRNEQCPCGSGKKYKRCHGANR
jgi:hypothetical protein